MNRIKKAYVGIGLLGIALVLAGIFIVPWARFNPFYMSQDDRLRRLMVRDQLQRLSVALESYKQDNGFYPTTEQGLDALVRQPRVPPRPQKYYQDGYIGRISVPKDPWGNAFMYKAPGGDRPYSITSRGRLAWYSGDDLRYPEANEALAKGAEKPQQ
ncbi:MAG TPA: type II secretion system major pseudopilin GspG [Bdellovibrionota bacterium]|nr:type II secretion system major pseudopilin GspG [Bdellovibrionota bacterium]